MNRPSIRPYATGHVVNAVSVRVIAAGLKLVWHDVHRFDRRPTGCELRAAQIAAHVGMTARTVEDHVATLLAMGLLVRLDGNGLAATVPDDCVPSSARPGWREVETLARRLEVSLSRYGQDRTSQAQKPAQVATVSDGNAPESPASRAHRTPSTVRTVPEVRSGPYQSCPTDYGADRTAGAQRPAQVGTVLPVVLGVAGEVGVTTPAGESARAQPQREEQRCPDCGSSLDLTARGRLVPCACQRAAVGGTR